MAAFRDLRGLLQDLDDRMSLLLGHGHVHARHQREVIGDMALVPIAEIIAHILGPLVGLGEEHAVLVVLVDNSTHLLDDGMCLGQVLVTGAVADAQIGDRIEAQPVHAHVEPKAHDPDDGLHDLRIVVVQVRLMGEEAVPVVLFGDRVPGPVGGLGVGEDDARL